MSTRSETAPVPITVTGWRIWDLHVARELKPDSMTRGILVMLDKSGVVAPENDRQVTASELDMILELFGGQALSFHLWTSADEHRLPAFVDKLIARYPALKGRTIQPNNQLRPPTCEAFLPVKKKHGLRIVLPHFTLYGADAWAPSSALADQVHFDASSGRNTQALNLDERAVDALKLITDATKVAIGLSGLLTAQSIGDLALRMHEVRAQLDRPLALAADTALRNDGSLDLAKVGKFYEASAKVLGLEGAAAPAAGAGA